MQEVNPAARALESILAVFANKTFSKDLSAEIVGGPKVLTDLIAQGKIHAEKPSNKQNGKWFCNAAEVLRHCRKRN